MLAYNIAQKDFNLAESQEGLKEVWERGYVSLPTFNQKPDIWFGHIEVWSEHIERLSQIHAELHLKPAYEAILMTIVPEDFAGISE